MLFTCFNKNLADYVATEFHRNPLIDVINFHELTRNLCNKYAVPYSVPDDDALKPHFYNVESAELLDKVSQFVSPKYDTIIVDEALDFKDTWWLALESLGAKDFSYYLFYDDCQNLYNQDVQWAPPFESEPYILDQNVRNTKPIRDFAANLIGVEPSSGYVVVNGPKPEIIAYSGPCRPVNPEQADQSIRSIPTTESGVKPTIFWS